MKCFLGENHAGLRSFKNFARIYAVYSVGQLKFCVVHKISQKCVFYSQEKVKNMTIYLRNKFIKNYIMSTEAKR